MGVVDVLHGGCGLSGGEAEGGVLEDCHSAGEESVSRGGKGIDE